MTGGTPCEQCGELIPPPIGRGGRRIRCEKCSPSRKRKRDNVPGIGWPSGVVPPSFPAHAPAPAPVVDPEPGPLERAVVAELEPLGRLMCVDGQVALDAARTVDSGRLSATARSLLLKGIRDACEQARKGASTGAGKLDELRARRASRAG